MSRGVHGVDDDVNARVQALEEILAHRESDLLDLSDMVSQQWKRIDDLEKELSRIKDRLMRLEDDMGEDGGADVKPPHW